MRIGRHDVFMNRYVVLLSWTDKGIAGFKDSTARAAKAPEAAAKLGGKGRRTLLDDRAIRSHGNRRVSRRRELHGVGAGHRGRGERADDESSCLR